jgi:hypothetical protein
MKQKLPRTIGVFSNFGGRETSRQSRSTKDGGEKEECRRNQETNEGKERKKERRKDMNEINETFYIKSPEENRKCQK